MNMNIKEIINKIKTHNDFSLESLEKLIPTLGLIDQYDSVQGNYLGIGILIRK